MSLHIIIVNHYRQSVPLAFRMNEFLFRCIRGSVRFRSNQTSVLADTSSLSDGKATASRIKLPSPSPKYDALARAVDVFDNIYFYKNDMFRSLCSEDRQVTLGDKTVKEVYLQFTEGETGGVASRLKSLAIAIKAEEAPILEYYKDVNVTIEELLHRYKRLALTSKKDLDIFTERPGTILPTATDILQRTMLSHNQKCRSLNLALVLGSSGSGKTYFALQDLAMKFLRKNVQEEGFTVALHIYPHETNVDFFDNNKQENPQAAADLCDWIKKAVTGHTRQEFQAPLKMHLCLIFDEAGDLTVRSWFEKKKMLYYLCRHAELLAESVAVVVSGTALTATELNSRDDAYIFRMQPWTVQDFAKLLQDKETSLSLVDGKETIHSLANSIFHHPKVGALATNARSAFFLSLAIVRLSEQYKSIVWKRQLDVWAPSLVNRVVEGYIDTNRLKNLKPNQRRLVAASIFHALRESKEGETVLPTFDFLQDNEVAVAMSLLQYNLELGKDNLTFVPHETFAVTVTPAIAVVLYACAGIPTTLMPGWKAEEELAALYAVRQLILASVETYFNDISCSDKIWSKEANQPNSAVHIAARTKLDQSLKKIELVKLQAQVKPKPDSSGNILIPMVGSSTVLLNGDMAPFADVIGPFTLIQTKQITSLHNSKKPLDMYLELQKCQLLKQGDNNSQVLRGLLEMWRGNLDPETTYPIGNEYELQPTTTTDELRNPQGSDAFPENILCLAKPNEQHPFAVIKNASNEITVGKTNRHLPPLDGNTQITFIISTNLEVIKVKLPPLGKTVITITRDILDSNLEVDATQTENNVVAIWTKFVHNKVRDGVKIKFLLTRSVGLQKRQYVMYQGQAIQN